MKMAFSFPIGQQGGCSGLGEVFSGPLEWKNIFPGLK